ncbi:MAG: 50S ribosomal protein L13 [bacterium]
MSQKTYVPKDDEYERQWVLLDAKDKVLGRLATRAARLLRGKHKPIFTPHLDCGDGVIVINASEITITGNKEVQDGLFSHSQYPGGDKHLSYTDLREEDPEAMIEWAVKGMLPKNKLRDKMMKHLRVYAGPDHEQQAQQPVEYDWQNDQILS